MPHHHLLDDEAPRGRWTPASRAEVLAAAREAVLRLEPDANGNVHRGEVLAALTDEGTT